MLIHRVGLSVCRQPQIVSTLTIPVEHRRTIDAWRRHCKTPRGTTKQDRGRRGQHMADTGSGIGRSVPRKEDDRYLRGRGEFVADIRLPGMQELAFVRSPVGPCAHPRHRTCPMAPRARVHRRRPRRRAADRRAIPRLPGFKISDQPVLAHDKVRHVGEPIAVCVAATRAEAEDLAAAVERRLRRAAGGRRHAATRDARRAAACTSTGATTSSWKPWWKSTSDRDPRQRADRGAPQLPHRAAMHVAARRPRRRRRLGPPAGAAPGLQLHADAAHRAHRAGRAASALTRAACASSRPMSAAASATRASCWPRKSCAALAGAPPRPSGALDRGPARAAHRQRQLPRAPLRHHRLRRRRRYACSALDAEATVDAGAYSAYPFSACLEAAQVACILPGPYTMRRLSLPHLVGGDQQAADPALSRRRARRRLLRLEADARRHRPRSRAGTARGPAAQPGAAGGRCRSTTSRRSISTAATIPNACAASSPRSICPRSGARQARRDRRRSASASASRSSASRRRTAPRSMPAGASRWCPASSRRVARMTPDGGLELRVGIQSPRPGAGDHAGAGGARGAGPAARRDHAWCTATPR